MCRHCADLTDDKEFVHKFMEVTAARLSRMHARTITADDIDIKIEIADPTGFFQERAATAAHRLLHDMRTNSWGVW
jgi:hypothetical protein